MDARALREIIVRSTIGAVPRITIVTPSLNQAAFLERTIRSVIEQDYPEIEYLVFDGGSTDGSVEILRRYADGIAYWESTPDRGQSHAVNKGFERATGEIVGWINSDDYYLPGALAAAAAAFEADPRAAWVCGACRYLHADGSLDMVLRPRLPRGPRSAWAYEPWYVPQASSFWRRTALERVGGLREDLHYAMDVDLGLRLALSGILPVTLDLELAVRAHHELAKSHDPSAWAPEYARIRAELGTGFAPHALVAGFCYRAVQRIRGYARELSATRS
jgi:glycosyltransferase involved in cell wall biosynthesis